LCGINDPMYHLFTVGHDVQSSTPLLLLIYQWSFGHCFDVDTDVARMLTSQCLHLVAPPSSCSMSPSHLESPFAFAAAASSFFFCLSRMISASLVFINNKDILKRVHSYLHKMSLRSVFIFSIKHCCRVHNWYIYPNMLPSHFLWICFYVVNH